MIGQLFTCQWVAIVSTVNFPFRKWVLQKHYKSLACVDLGFSQRREGLPPANMPYAEHSACDISLYFQQPLETVRKAQHLAEGHSCAAEALTRVLCSSYDITLTASSPGGGDACAKWMATQQIQLAILLCPILAAPWGERGRKGEAFELVHYHWPSSPENYSVRWTQSSPNNAKC